MTILPWNLETTLLRKRHSNVEITDYCCLNSNISQEVKTKTESDFMTHDLNLFK